MKMKNLLMTTIAIFGLAIISNAQVPNYIPSNGLVGWWPFNGNAFDISGNGNNGIVTGAVLTSDRFSNANNAYFFNGINNWIETNTSFLQTNNPHSISIWWQTADSTKYDQTLFNTDPHTLEVIGFNFPLVNYSLVLGLGNGLIGPGSWNILYPESISSPPALGQWHNTVLVKDSSLNWRIYHDGFLIHTFNSATNTGSQIASLRFGAYTANGGGGYFIGNLDDIGVWNRALTQQEINYIYNASNCSNNLTISPVSNQLQTSGTANFTAITSDQNPSYVWQSDFGQGFQTLNDYGNYTGVNTNSLSISNVQLPNHTQPIRVISTSGECIDTSNVATISITDTCILTINDTITTLISVTDTLVINTLITGLTPPNNLNTIKVFPNPANNHITIDFGNFASMNGYTLKITNSIGQIVFTTQINQQSSYVDLSTWGGNGIYFVQIIDSQNNTTENRKIVLQ